ncbi:UDP-glucose dehydrogenase family protein [Bovifimicola ammoniilytica]|jgi:UDPglucose 6-dehydrogenase|uniref:UDP-glucose dehydrogenase family protein n=1 Tax=Bovifimicola ammoniilytica TaxID=2981720 RepID=UPI00033CE586|nr:UDP-glucose/GDP-mannose dehydrogenase family protein [Bovifimicola ammoniilytica]MCU6752387.1 UDP-glucose/GDP-mannose dehydrogenase family protein [Bovifimicola ammoniilytica]CCZ04296.1 nucleotide sugar dehydrogenase [Eubacterium sp. CAG:603]SCJ23057.1 UDP-glucose 6-dehydrogenase ywqF [uncultured Eubacterium sp.]
MKIAVAGTGYVGLVTGVCLAEHGHNVVCVDVDEEKVAKMSKGISPIYEPGLDDLMIKNMERLTFTTDYASAYKDAEVIFIGVGTPEKKDGSANLTYVYKVAEQIAENAENDCIVVIKSTVPIGTNDKVEAFITEKAKDGISIHIASNPEFLAQGTAVRDTLHASRIVIGAESKYAANILKEVYKDFDAPILVTNRRSAEMIKYASNDFLALKISYVNEIANLCEIVGADINDVTKGMGYDPRIGDKFLNAGIGYGGSCFPKDTKALHWLANFNDYELKTVKAAIETNDNQKFKIIKKARKYYENLQGKKIAVLGLTFKPGTDDLREAPSLVNIPIFLDEGCEIKAWDPAGVENYKKKYPTEIIYCDSIDEAIKDADLCVIFTEWDEVKKYDITKFEKLMRNPIVIDGRNCYDLEQIKKTNVIYDSMGRKTVNLI